MAHRGGATFAANIGLENTTRAIANAVAAGYRYVETDVHASRDGTVFAFHDESLDRVSDSRGRFRDLDSAVVALARIGDGEAIPTMADLFDAFPRVRFNIDVKNDAAVQPVVDLVRRTATHDRVCLAAFSARRVRRLRSLLGPGVATSMGTAEVAGLRLSPSTALRRIVASSGAACVQVPHRVGPLTVVSDRFVAACHELGLQVHVWTVDDAALMHTLLDRGVDGLITDRIDVLKDVLVARGSWVGEAV